MAIRVPSFVTKYTNPRTIAERLTSMMDEGMVNDEIVHAVFQRMRSDRCTEDAIRLVCDRFLQDYVLLKGKNGGAAKSREQWDMFLDETVHYIRQVSGGRVRWKEQSTS